MNKTKKPKKLITLGKLPCKASVSYIGTPPAATRHSPPMYVRTLIKMSKLIAFLGGAMPFHIKSKNHYHKQASVVIFVLYMVRFHLLA